LIMLDPIDISKIFKINLEFRVSLEHRNRWLAVINELTQYTKKELIDEAKNVIADVGKDHPRLYYLEAVRRRLMIKKNENYKSMKMPESIRNLFK